MSARKYDIETFRDQIIALVQANLGAKITAINTEKDDTLSIDDIAAENYYNDITDQVVNISPFIYYGFDRLESETVGAQTRTSITLFVSVVFDNTNQTGTESKVLRYTRCLKEIIQENSKKIPAASPLSVTEFLPVNFELNKGSDFKVGGIHVTATIVG